MGCGGLNIILALKKNCFERLETTILVITTCLKDLAQCKAGWGGKNHSLSREGFNKKH